MLNEREWRAQALVLDRIAEQAAIHSESTAWHIAEIARQIRARAPSWGNQDPGAAAKRPAK